MLDVLYVEDNASNVLLVERLLARRGGARLLTASTGREGLRLAAQSRPDLVLLDLHLPDLPGLVVLERLRGLPGMAAVPLLVLTADATASAHERALAAGAEDVLVKPLDVARFYRRLGTVEASRARPGQAC